MRGKGTKFLEPRIRHGGQVNLDGHGGKIFLSADFADCTDLLFYKWGHLNAKRGVSKE